VNSSQSRSKQAGPVDAGDDRPKVTAVAQSTKGAESKVNQDAVCCDGPLGLFVVADGMGGYEFGNEASALVVEKIRSAISEKDPLSVVTNAHNMVRADMWRSFLAHAIAQANVQLCRMAGERRAPMGSTATVALLRDQHLIVAHVGDCRLYLIGREFAPEALTRDHRAGGAGSNQLDRSWAAA